MSIRAGAVGRIQRTNLGSCGDAKVISANFPFRDFRTSCALTRTTATVFLNER
jgi:hypothetical protein